MKIHADGRVTLTCKRCGLAELLDQEGSQEWLQLLEDAQIKAEAMSEVYGEEFVADGGTICIYCLREEEERKENAWEELLAIANAARTVH